MQCKVDMISDSANNFVRSAIDYGFAFFNLILEGPK